MRMLKGTRSAVVQRVQVRIQGLRAVRMLEHHRDTVSAHTTVWPHSGHPARPCRVDGRATGRAHIDAPVQMGARALEQVGLPAGWGPPVSYDTATGSSAQH